VVGCGEEIEFARDLCLLELAGVSIKSESLRDIFEKFAE